MRAEAERMRPIWKPNEVPLKPYCLPKSQLVPVAASDVGRAAHNFPVTTAQTFDGLHV